MATGTAPAAPAPTGGATTPGAAPAAPLAAAPLAGLTSPPYGFGTGTPVNNRALALLNVRSTKNA